MPTTFNVTDEADLNADITTIDAAASGAYQLDLTGNILETTALEAINLHSGVTLTIDGGGFALDGASQQRGLFYSGDVAIEDLTIQNATAKGGAGGGGLFVGAAGAVTLNDVMFSGDSAVGGDGGAVGAASSSGGGMGGNGGAGNGSVRLRRRRRCQRHRRGRRRAQWQGRNHPRRLGRRRGSRVSSGRRTLLAADSRAKVCTSLAVDSQTMCSPLA